MQICLVTKIIGPTAGLETEPLNSCLANKLEFVCAIIFKFGNFFSSQLLGQARWPKKSNCIYPRYSKNLVFGP